MRTLESYNKHLKKIEHCGKSAMMLRNESDLLKPLYIFPIRCHSDYHVACRELNLRKLRNAIIHSMKKDKWRLVTLTFPQSEITGDERFRTLHKTFDKFMKRIRRACRKVKFAKSLEIHKSGYPHIHLLVNYYLPQKFLMESWKAVGGGSADIREGIKCHIHKKKACRECFYDYEKLIKIKAAQYITEELEKTFQDPHKLGYDFWKFRRRAFSTSRNFKLNYNSSNYSYLNRFASWLDARVYCSYIFHDINIFETKHGFCIGNEFRNNFVAANDCNDRFAPEDQDEKPF